MKKIGVALLGLGVVGGGTYKILTEKREYIRQNDGVDIEVRCVVEKNLERCKELGVDPSIVTTDIERVVSDPGISVVAEFFGGIEPAKSFLIKALEAGKSIVTANKEMFSKSWPSSNARRKRAAAGCTSRRAARAASPSYARSPRGCRATASHPSRALSTARPTTSSPV